MPSYAMRLVLPRKSRGNVHKNVCVSSFHPSNLGSRLFYEGNSSVYLILPRLPHHRAQYMRAQYKIERIHWISSNDTMHLFSLRLSVYEFMRKWRKHHFAYFIDSIRCLRLRNSAHLFQAVNCSHRTWFGIFVVRRTLFKHTHNNAEIVCKRSFVRIQTIHV